MEHHLFISLPFPRSPVLYCPITKTEMPETTPVAIIIMGCQFNKLLPFKSRYSKHLQKLKVTALHFLGTASTAILSSSLFRAPTRQGPRPPTLSENIVYLQPAHVLLLDDLSLNIVDPAMSDRRIEQSETGLCFVNAKMDIPKW